MFSMQETVLVICSMTNFKIISYRRKKTPLFIRESFKHPQMYINQPNEVLSFIQPQLLLLCGQVFDLFLTCNVDT